MAQIKTENFINGIDPYHTDLPKGECRVINYRVVDPIDGIDITLIESSDFSEFNSKKD